MHIKRVSVQWGFTVQVVLPFPSGTVGHLAKHTKHVFVCFAHSTVPEKKLGTTYSLTLKT